jgi:hypothetical protein
MCVFYKLFTYNSCIVKILVCLKMIKYTNCLHTIRVIQIVYCFSEDVKQKSNMVVRFTKGKLYKKTLLKKKELSFGYLSWER